MDGVVVSMELFGLGVMAGFVVGMIAGTVLFVVSDNDIMERNAIERGYALYCPLTGEFAWKGECE